MRFLLLFLLTFGVRALTQKIGYENYKVYQVKPATHQHFELLESIRNNPEADFLSSMCHAPGSLDVMISPEFQADFETRLNQQRIDFKIIIQDVERLVEEERLAQAKANFLPEGKISFDRYNRYSEIQDYLSRLAKDYSDVVTIQNYGTSYEGRNLTLIHISTGGQGQKPLIFLDAGIHAREWIGPSQALYIIDQLLERPENRHLIQNVDWVVIPLLNPDGYEYTHTTRRAWRKTRSKGRICDGVDPNRNFDFHWQGPGGHNFECSKFYAGPTAFSEVESLALSEAILDFADRARLYLTFHSAAQCLLYPWGYTAEPPENVDELHNLAMAAEKAIFAVNGTHYEVGSSYTTLNPASGSSRDWAYAVAGINLAYTMELPPGGDKGFDLPPERILGVVREMFKGVKVFHEYIELNSLQ